DEMSEKHNFSAVMAIPEFNLLDCRSTAGEKLITNLPGDSIKLWLEARANAQTAMDEQNIDQLFIHARKMIDIDSTHPLGFEMLADANIAVGKYDEARELLELGRDTAIFWRSNSKPRMLQVVRRTTLQASAKHNIPVLDIPDVFKQYLGGKIPGRDMFLDYCHFTALGIQVAMQPLSELVLELFENDSRNILSASEIKPDRKTLEMGHLFAAIHNAHWGQVYPILKHHCEEAFKASKDVAKIMVYYCDMISRSVSNNLTKSLELILGNKIQIARYGHALMHPKDFKNMDLDLMRAMIETLKENGINIIKFIEELRIKEHSVNGRSIDLLNSLYHATSYDIYQGVHPAFYQARDIYSKFFVISSDNTAIDLSVSLRVPDTEYQSNKIEFHFNGKKIGEIESSPGWTNHKLQIPSEDTIYGINELMIAWPVPVKVAKKSRESGDILKSFYYVFGDISHFKATGVDIDSNEKSRERKAENLVEQ
ncbi:MAG: hypothetical protein WBA74_02585, partial [Cyclobacteriaceae bacterium]